MSSTSVYPRLEKTSDNQNYDGRVEIWPDLVHIGCPACNIDHGMVRWEKSGFVDPEDTSEDQALRDAARMASDFEKYDGLEPCCSHCGVRLSGRESNISRPDVWKQPFFIVVNDVSGLSPISPGVDNLLSSFECDSFGFINASKSRLTRVDGIGSEFASRIAASRVVHYPDEARSMDEHVYSHRCIFWSELTPEQLAHDVEVFGTVENGGIIDVDKLSETEDVRRKAAEYLDERCSANSESLEDEVLYLHPDVE